MTSSNVPKFGQWEGEENVPYTAYFEKARKVRTSGGSNTTKPHGPEQEEIVTSQPKTEHEEPVKTSLDSGEASGNKKQGTGRSKPRSNHKGDESPKKNTVVPKFGDWDENDPGSAGYTHIFDKVREERTSGSNVPSSSRTPTQSSSQKTSYRSKFCCF